MNADVTLILDALPQKLREETRDYAAWVEDHASGILASLGPHLSDRVPKDAFVTLAVCKKILDYPRLQLRTIRTALGQSLSHGIAALEIRGETLAPRAPGVLRLEELQRRIQAELHEQGVGYVVDASGLKSLARLMARGTRAE